MKRRQFMKGLAGGAVAAMVVAPVMAKVGEVDPAFSDMLASWVSVGSTARVGSQEYTYRAVCLMPDGKEWEYARAYDHSLSDDELRMFLHDAANERRIYWHIEHQIPRLSAMR